MAEPTLALKPMFFPLYSMTCLRCPRRSHVAWAWGSISLFSYLLPTPSPRPPKPGHMVWLRIISSCIPTSTPSIPEYPDQTHSHESTMAEAAGTVWIQGSGTSGFETNTPLGQDGIRSTLKSMLSLNGFQSDTQQTLWEKK